MIPAPFLRGIAADRGSCFPCPVFTGFWLLLSKEGIMKEFTNVTEIFGSNVFNDAVMQERLTKKVYKETNDSCI